MAVENLAPRPLADASAVIDDLMAATGEGMEAVNRLILSRSDSPVDMVPEVANHLIDAGGKRLRPMLTLAASALFGRPGGNEIRFAAAVEFMHNATLLHDDVVDESDMRRGRPAARTIWGNQASVLVGDFLLGQAFLMMVESRDIDALGVLSRAAAIIAEGEVFQLAKAGDLSTTPDDYEKIIHAKTATLFEAATEVGAMAGGADSASRKALAAYGRELGMAFQLVDDVLDYGGAQGALGKNTGDDLREGKMTLPVILALQAGTEGERKTIERALGNPASGESQLADILAIFARYDCLSQTMAKAERHAEAARAALAKIPPSLERDILFSVPEFCTSRAY
ncbi:polyprenyl synthetase family protein [Pelagibacterium halotolerans]|uniref:Octaprenyl-diphosphate synthase / dimethylallyltransferase / geranyltranstransferase (Farnesyldiphosphate synthase) / geranylgeranyl pyrophosphate synthetase n=1 Tax=Pelagibacterium halotolerans (strain DSM 22347 / JCM 15775 / CGMCC 1.7692 / B2) TaxID=1082931 RepID=G4RBS6_PELHB|nr:polyprenyl synthetase family protein [Pelagibacterium halotolerans]AEQ50589.1 octaprenyl-diphosphate synthase / dimethylallyltransferase / geranyltranstransferase (farnesyldiphosphate synthase) / geranylgeranyl pyrophosphate synthetase [Pelagibacterium halotolerans B2]SDZ90496.1 octaprenyl-diphosphate synthase [Pelagibacterium halotolerans]